MTKKKHDDTDKPLLGDLPRLRELLPEKSDTQIVDEALCILQLLASGAFVLKPRQEVVDELIARRTSAIAAAVEFASRILHTVGSSATLKLIGDQVVLIAADGTYHAVPVALPNYDIARTEEKH